MPKKNTKNVKLKDNGQNEKKEDNNCHEHSPSLTLKDNVVIVKNASGETFHIKEQSYAIRMGGPNTGQGPPQYFNPPPPTQGYMTSYQPQYSPVMSPPLTSPPPPPHNYQKNERNGGRDKMRAKFYPPRHPGMSHFQQGGGGGAPVHIKNNLNNLHHASPPLSPKKDNSILRKPDEEVVNGEVADGPPITLQELLSHIKSIEISNIEAFRASVAWCAPDLSYFAEKEPLSALQYDIILNGQFYNSVSIPSIELVELRPGTEQRVSLICSCNGVRGHKIHASFCTLATVPDQPSPARIIDKKKASLAFRWNAPKDNGARINNYNVEIIGGHWTCWTQIQHSRNRDITIQKLKPQTTYRIRYAASNEIGRSEFSKETIATTVGLAPSQPNSPSLAESTVTSLRLSWTQRPSDESFSLEMDDSLNDYGFRPVFHGRETEYMCRNLRRNSHYKFRISCQNLNGKSPYSEIASHRTLPDRPQAPPAPSLKGNPAPEKLIFCWLPPADDGGTEITAYTLQIDRGNDFESIYTGPNFECDARNLTPGTNYQVRICASNVGGSSAWSETRTMTTKPVEPGQCKPPRVAAKPKANTLQLKWGHPDFDGGSMVTEYHVEMVTSNSERKRVYNGRELECTVASLLPGRPYIFVLRAANKEGSGPWSEPFEVVSGAGPPDAPRCPHLACKGPHSVLVSWEEPINNGARVENYDVEVAEVNSSRTESSCESSSSTETEELIFSQVYSGLALSAEVRNLTPANTFAFKIIASNMAGTSPYSGLSSVTTPAAAPAAVSRVTSTPEATQVTLRWSEPKSHGDSIIHYNIDIGADELINTPSDMLEYTITDLLPETPYKIRLQAVNSVGRSPFTTHHRFTTQPLPPSPPQLELVKASFNCLRLKWGTGKNNDLLKYTLMMELLNPHNTMEFYQVYRGTNQGFKVGKLEENTSYRLRICATNDAGTGPQSDTVEFSTTKAPPLPLKAPRVKEGPNGTYCIEWCGVRCPGEDTILYRLQMLQAGKDQDYSLIYAGSETSFIKSDLDADAGYYVRVSGVRMSGDVEVISGGYSSPTLFNTPKVEVPQIDETIVQSTKEFSWRDLSDQQKAIGIMILFGLFAFVAAYFLSPEPVR